MERAERAGLRNRLNLHETAVVYTPQIFGFELEQRLQCDQTREVKYTSGAQMKQNMLELPIPDTYPDSTGALSLSACLAQYFSPETVSFRHPSGLLPAGTATKSVLFRTFPRYLVIKLNRYYVDSAWVQRKKDVKVVVPEVLDLRGFASRGPGEGEVRMRDSEEEGGGGGGAGAASVPMEEVGAQVDEAVVAQLVSMGFSENGSRRAAYATGSSSAEDAMTWVLEHMEDPDFNEPFQPQVPGSGSGRGGGEVAVDENLVQMLADSLGCTTAAARKALRATGGDLDR